MSMPGILIIGEHLNGSVRDITKEMIGAALTIKDRLGGPLIVALISENPAALTVAVNLHGVDQIVTGGPCSSSSRIPTSSRESLPSRP